MLPTTTSMSSSGLKITQRSGAKSRRSILPGLLSIWAAWAMMAPSLRIFQGVSWPSPTFRMETFWNTTEDGMPHGAAMRSTLTPWIRLTEARCTPAMRHALCPRSRTRITSGSQAQGPKDATKTSTTTDTVWSLDPSLKSTFVGPSSDLDAVSR